MKKYMIMLSLFYMNLLIDITLQAARNSTKIFGGVKMMMVLDPKQLPPVPDILYSDEGRFCFESPVWKNSIKHKVYFLKTASVLLSSLQC